MSDLWKTQYEQPYLVNLIAEDPPKLWEVITSRHVVKSLKTCIFTNTAGKT